MRRDIKNSREYARVKGEVLGYRKEMGLEYNSAQEFWFGILTSIFDKLSKKYPH